MTLHEFLRTKTYAKELCVIRESGYIVASAWIDYEDLFRLPHDLLQREVKGDKWGYLSVVNENNIGFQIPCHYVDV